MFTGIIQDVGRIAAIARESDQTHMRFSTRLDMSGWQLGDSVAVDGCCLTITGFPADQLFAATLSPETLSLTRLGDAEVGWAVNLEPALRMGDALGGHLVSGHVDGLARVVSLADIGEHRQITFAVPDELARYIVVKGSVTLNGVSLTVNAVERNRFTVNLIPHTLSHTNLDALREGSKVNLETDMMGRYVERLLSYVPSTSDMETQ